MRLTVTVPDEIAASARQLAADTDRSVSAVVAEAVAAHVANARRQAAFDIIDGLTAESSPEANGPESFDAELRALRAGSDRSGSPEG